MADKSAIEWTDATWNPVTGCTVVSPGCSNCYAMRLAGWRLKHHPSRRSLTKPGPGGPVWNGVVRFNGEWLDQPLRWRRPHLVFVCAHGDLFHEAVPDEWIDRVFAVMALAPAHTFQVLTKRAERMAAYIASARRHEAIDNVVADMVSDRDVPISAQTRWSMHSRMGSWLPLSCWPLPNVWLGVSAEDQTRADERVPILLETPAAVRFVSAEPLLGPVDLAALDLGEGVRLNALSGKRWPDKLAGEPRYIDRLDWLIVGGESGAGARPMHPDWARPLRDQCREGRVPFFFKQWGEWLVGEGTKPREHDYGLPLCFADGDEFDVISDGHDILFCAALDEREGPRHLDWRDYYGWRGELLRRVGKKRAGRILDGRTWDEMPRTTERPA